MISTKCDSGTILTKPRKSSGIIRNKGEKKAWELLQRLAGGDPRMAVNLFQRVSQSPHAPARRRGARTVRCGGPKSRSCRHESGAEAAAFLPLDEKLQQAYFWIVNNAIMSPFYDIEYHEGSPASLPLGGQHCSVTLPSGQSYASFVLLPVARPASRPTARCGGKEPSDAFRNSPTPAELRQLPIRLR
jgi:hypothetical protein